MAKLSDELPEVKRNLKKIKTLEEALAKCKQESSKLNRKIQTLLDEIRNLQDRNNELRNSTLTVTEHAVIRYLERVEGLDVQAIKNKLATEELQKQVSVLGGGEYPVNIDGNRVKVVVRNFKVITVKD